MIDTSTLPHWVEDVDERPDWDRGDAWVDGQFGSIWWAMHIAVPVKAGVHRYGR